MPEAVVLVRAGDTIPADGVVIDGRSGIDSALLTGESGPVSVGDLAIPCYAGTTNAAAALRVRVDRGRRGDPTRPDPPGARGRHRAAGRRWFTLPTGWRVVRRRRARCWPRPPT